MRRIRVKQTLKPRIPSGEFYSFIAAFGIIALAESLGIAEGTVYRWLRKECTPTLDNAADIIGLSQSQKIRLKLHRSLSWDDVVGRVEVERADYA